MMKIIKRILFLSLLCSYVINSEGCKGCARKKNELSVEELKKIRYEFLKNQILTKLHMTEPPKTNLPKPPLKYLLVIAKMTENETVSEPEDLPKTESVVIYPKEINLTCFERQCNRFHFVIPESLSLDNFASAELWVPTWKSNNSIRVQLVIANHLSKIQTKVELNNVMMEKHVEYWSKYEILSSNFITNSSNRSVLIFEVVDGNENNHPSRGTEILGGEKPFLVIRNKIDETLLRTKRSTSCFETSTSCCKENFFLNFSEIGWDNWILHPDGYQANFCRGYCFNDLSNTRFYHSAVLLSYIRDNKDIAEEIGLNMCCTPSVMEPVTIIYRNEEGLIYHKSIENMRVEACNCA